MLALCLNKQKENKNCTNYSENNFSPVVYAIGSGEEGRRNKSRIKCVPLLLEEGGGKIRNAGMTK